MKRKIGTFIFMMVMALSLVACGKVPEEKLKEMDTLVSDCKVVIDDTYKEIEKINNTGYEDVQEAYEMIITALKAADTEYISMKNNIDDTRGDMTEEMVDEMISVLKKTKMDLEQMKQDGISGRKAIEEEMLKMEQNVTEVRVHEETGEGIGKSTMPTQNEIDLMFSYNTANWSDLLQDEKWTAVQTTLRMWENVDGYIDYDIDQVLSDIDFQMNTYIKNKVDIDFFETICDIYGIDKDKYLK